ncbi:hypothetical protein CH295_21860 [Rhodococcus sp. 14-2483-1-2]|nr:hypothetical protein CH295_21860 [Rhodococcus sp. 14-2483-1-2]
MYRSVSDSGRSPTASTPPEVSAWQYKAVFELLEVCQDARSLSEFKVRLVESLGEMFGYANTTFLQGATYADIFDDAKAVTQGRTTAILEEYHERWRDKDIFRLPASAKALVGGSVLSHTQIGRIPDSTKSYLSEFLYRHKLHSVSAMHLNLPNNGHALVGIFDSADMEPDETDLHVLRLVARQLTCIARTMPSDEQRVWLDRLTTRQQQIAALVAEGRTNDELALELGFTLDTAKKHVSRIFSRVGVRNRAEFVREYHAHTIVRP